MNQLDLTWVLVLTRLENVNKLNIEVVVEHRGITDHSMSVANIQSSNKEQQTKQNEYSKIDMLDSYLQNADWNAVYSLNDVNKSFEVFITILRNAINDSKCVVKINKNAAKLKPWVTDHPCNKTRATHS